MIPDPHTFANASLVVMGIAAAANVMIVVRGMAREKITHR
jgi:hypothetical protein